MSRNPERCEFRRTIPAEHVPPTSESEEYECGLVRQILGTDRRDAARTTAAACGECCRHRFPSTTHINPVIASLVYRGAESIVGDAASSWFQKQEASRARDYVVEWLEVSRPDQKPRPNGSTLDHGPETKSARPAHRRQVVWAAGLLTAPRQQPTIHRAARSLVRAGFGPLHIFAEPGSWIPGEIAHWPATRHGRTLGNLGNFLTSLTALLMLEPSADCYVVFQDDVQAADGLREWCEGQLWPEDRGLLSLYTCGAVHGEKRGWRVLRPGLHHTFGGLGFVFRPDVLREFLADGRSHDIRAQRPSACDDLVVGEWASRRGIGIAYHTPSLLDHIGAVSAIDANAHGTAGPLSRTAAARHVRDLDSWKPARRTVGKVGLVGWNTASGLGSVNRDIATHFPVARWLAPRHPAFTTLGPPPGSVPIDHVNLNLGPNELRSWLRGLDWVLFVELPYFPSLVGCARELGIQVACVPMWEYLDISLEWVRMCDLMICPNRFSYELLSQWKSRFGYGWEIAHVPWPIDASRFRYRPRKRCERFLFLNGTGGGPARNAGGTETPYRRKGLDVVIETARLLPQAEFVVSSQVEIDTPLPRNVRSHHPAEDNASLYDLGDVCVQPSRWEGLGLQLLECQAAGLPLITTDAPPMNEYQPLRAVPARECELVTVYLQRVVTSHNVAAEDLAAVLEPLWGADISEASRRARSFIEENHSWERALSGLWNALAR